MTLRKPFTRRQLITSATAMGAAALATPMLSTRARASGPVQLVSHRYPALEYYAEQLGKAAPEAGLNAQLMPFPKAFELMNIALSSKSDSIDIMYVNESMTGFMRSGWLRPMDDIWDMFREEFALDDIDPNVLKYFQYEGKTYGIPLTAISHLFFYRQDLFDEAGRSVPTTIDEYVEAAEYFNSPLRAGTVNCLRDDSALGEAHWYLNAIGEGWFDENFEPVFNSEAGIAALSKLKQVTQYAQPGFLNAHNDECMIALQQDVATMGVSWTTRAGAMDDPTKSAVVDQMGFAPLPGGHGRLALDGYAISAFSSHDPETLFRMICTAASQEAMRGATSYTMVPRVSVLTDPEVQAQYRHYAAGLEALETAVPFPSMPEFYSVGEFIRRRLLQSIAGEMEMAEAMDTAAEEVRGFLAEAGYYQ